MEQFAQTLLRILEFILALGVLIFLHELGHYAFSKLFRVEVEEFGFGFPPRMLKLFRFQETDFTLNWIPFGAFVRPKGENDPAVGGGMAAASPWKRLLILLGGPLFNLLTAVLIFSFVISVSGVADRTRVQVVGVNKGSPAETAGLQEGDILVSVDGQSISNTDQIRTIVSTNLGKEISIVYSRDGKEITTSSIPRAKPPEGEGALGIYMGNPTQRITWLQSLPYAVGEVTYQAEALITLPAKLINGQVSAEQARVVGPLGMYTIYNTVRDEDVQVEQQTKNPLPVLTLALLATISAALGITNLLPLPALDGGRILFVLPELLFRRRVPSQYENTVHLIGFAALIILMVLITAQDILNPIQLR